MKPHITFFLIKKIIIFVKILRQNISMIKLLGIVLFTIYRTIKVITRGLINKSKGNYFYEEMKKWANELLHSTGTQIIVNGLENICNNSKNVDDEKYIYISNHTNLLDIPILIKALAHDKINFMYRKSLQKVPVLGFALKYSPFISIVRENIKKTNMELANNILQNAGSVVIFPEGTRSRTGKITKFKRGAFTLASLSNKKIVPICISGVENITPPNKTFKINKGKVIVQIGQPITKLPTERNELLKVIEQIEMLFAEMQNINNNLLN